jgi:4-carboxymuconolactone decarboxylase
MATNREWRYGVALQCDEEVAMNISTTIRVIFLASVGLLALGGSFLIGTVVGSTDSGVASLPKDIYPDSRNRLPNPKREDMDDFGKEVFDEQTGPRLAWTKQVPLRLYSPQLAKPMADAHYYLKYQSGLGDRLTAIAVLVTAREMDNQFEWTQWELHARMPGDGYVEPGIIDLIKYNKPVTGLGEKETVIIKFGRELFGKKKVSSETFAHALKLFGPKGTVNLTNLMALYVATGIELNAFDQQLMEGQKPLLPPR